MYLDATSSNFERRYLRSHVYANFSPFFLFFFLFVVPVLTFLRSFVARVAVRYVLLTPCIHNDDDDDEEDDEEDMSE